MLVPLYHDHIVREHTRQNGKVKVLSYGTEGNTTTASSNMEGVAYREMITRLEATALEDGSGLRLYDRVAAFVMDKDTAIYKDIERRNALRREKKAEEEKKREEERTQSRQPAGDSTGTDGIPAKKKRRVKVRAEINNERVTWEILIALDPGHVKKNVVGKLRSIFRAKKEYVGLDYRMAQFFIRIIKRGEEDTVHIIVEHERRAEMVRLLRERIDHMIFHYFGVCDNACPHHQRTKEGDDVLRELKDEYERALKRYYNSKGTIALDTDDDDDDSVFGSRLEAAMCDTAESSLQYIDELMSKWQIISRIEEKDVEGTDVGDLSHREEEDAAEEEEEEFVDDKGEVQIVAVDIAPAKMKKVSQMTAKEKEEHKWAKKVTPEMGIKIQALHDEIAERLRRKQQTQMEQLAAVTSHSQRDPAVAKAMAFWKKTIPLDDAAGIWKKVMVVLLEFDANGELPSICHGYNTCQVESFHSNRAATADKTRHWHANWEPICEVTALEHNLGRRFLVPIMEALHVHMTEEELAMIERQEDERMQLVRARSSAAIRMRLMRREKRRKIERLKRQVDKTWAEKMSFVDLSVDARRTRTYQHLPYLFSTGSKANDESDDEDSD